MDEIKKSAERIGSTVSETIEKVGETPFVKDSKEKVSYINLKLLAVIFTTLHPFFIGCK